LNNMSLTAGTTGTLTLDATAKTFRYLDQEEILAQRKSVTDKKLAKP
jgi:type IV pilus assembly protein PilO